MEDKKRGLSVSKGEKVGFLERLRMGNIDDPKSEAYKRFGAGRGKAETAKEKAAIKSYKGPPESGSGSRDSPSPFTGSTGETPAKSAMPKPKPKPKNRIVTEEELKKSGFTNLRDFLNDEQGLKRRDGKPAVKMGVDKTASGMPREARGVKPTPAPAVKAGEGKTASGLPREARGMSRLESDTAKAKEDMNKFMSQSGKLGTMAKGGMVKKKCDGIARKGKTKGRMV
jgi:hypothetical protein